MQSASRLILSSLAAIALLGLSAAVLSAAEGAAPAEDHTADFKVLTTDLTNLEALFAQFTDPVHKVPVSGYIRLLKQRAILLGWTPPPGMALGGGGGRGGDGGDGGGYGRKGGDVKVQFDQVKFDELRYDINLWYQRMAIQLAPLRTPPPAPPSELAIDLRELRPNPANPAEVKAALDLLDREIKRLERAHAMRLGSVAPQVEEGRISRLKEFQGILAKQFTAVRWQQLVSELNSVE